MKTSPEQDLYLLLEQWRPSRKLLSAKSIVDNDHKLFTVFTQIYTIVRKQYRKLPRRKNGDPAFLHPLNVVYNLQKSGINEPITLCVGLAHDYIEEEVDLYKKRSAITPDRRGKRILDSYAKEVAQKFYSQVLTNARKSGISQNVVKRILDAMLLLTRYKKDYYYSSLAQIFREQDRALQECALQVKLSDRLHNIHTIENFDEERRIYECFKSLFLLNNTKKYLLKRYGPRVFTDAKYSPTEKLFNKLCKSTYEALLNLLALERKKGLGDVPTLLQLAFKKYVFEVGGLEKVTAIRKNEHHPIKLFRGVIRKYDARLHHEMHRYERFVREEVEFTKSFFAEFRFSMKQIKALLSYKDAYSLKEVAAKLLYDHDYMLEGFLVQDLKHNGRIKKPRIIHPKKRR